MDRKKSSGIVPHPLPSLKPKPEPNRNLRLFFVGLGLGLELVLRFSFRFWPSMYSAGQNHRWLIFLVVPFNLLFSVVEFSFTGKIFRLPLVWTWSSLDLNHNRFSLVSQFVSYLQRVPKKVPRHDIEEIHAQRKPRKIDHFNVVALSSAGAQITAEQYVPYCSLIGAIITYLGEGKNFHTPISSRLYFIFKTCIIKRLIRTLAIYIYIYIYIYTHTHTHTYIYIYICQTFVLLMYISL